mgnify:FL=1
MTLAGAFFVRLETGGERMSEYKKYFEAYCREHDLELRLSFEMPVGYETANGTFDVSSRTVFINAEKLNKEPEYSKLFYLFHELRHASQYLEPGRFNETIKRSIQYIMMFDGTCYKLEGNRYLKCRLEGGEEYFNNLYLGQPHEVDANRFAYEQARKICGDSVGLKKLVDFWMPRQMISNDVYDKVFALIDEKTKMMA